MFRKLMAIETEAARLHSRESVPDTDPTEASLLAMAEDLAHCMPVPSRFGICSSRHDF